MIQTILTVPRFHLEKNKEWFEESALIVSIIEPGVEPIFTEDTDRIITLYFSDLTPDPFLSHEYLLDTNMRFCSTEDAKKISDFILGHAKSSTPEVLVIQCSAGVSRSGALAVFALRYSEMNDAKFVHLNPNIKPNQWVLWKLIEAMLETEKRS